MMEMIEPAVDALQGAKLATTQGLSLSKDALHIHVGIAVFIAACLLLRWKASDGRAWMLVLVLALIGEVTDLYIDVDLGRPLDLLENWKDVVNTLAAPTLILLAARYSSIFKPAPPQSENVEPEIGAPLGDEPES